jgi:hypothetical protein
MSYFGFQAIPQLRVITPITKCPAAIVANRVTSDNGLYSRGGGLQLNYKQINQPQYNNYTLV